MSKRWVSKKIGMFTGGDQTENFRSMASIFPCRVVRRSDKPHRFATTKPLRLPSTYRYESERRSTAALLADTETVGLMVLHRGRIAYEKYWLGVTPTTQWALFSITKSWLSALIGIAVAERAIESVDNQVTDYVPRLAGSAYDGATIKHVLQMSSGARWDESYADADSDIRQTGRELAAGGARTEVAESLQREFEPGTYHRYSSIDTHVLSLVLRRATHQTPTDYLREKIWARLGAESDAFWIVEGDGREWAGAGLNATLRDTAKLGLLYCNAGRWGRTQIIPRDWIQASVTPDAAHLAPGYRESSASLFGYGYQWWRPDLSPSYCAFGVYNQFVYVDPVRSVVVTKLSANRKFASGPGFGPYSEREHVEFFHQIAARCD
ncbi:MAG TPA: serine hydrolase [Polyangiales bacterium]|nr:serine hydrolase [Polyangiales bacterium]